MRVDLTRACVRVGALCAALVCSSENEARAKVFNLTLQYTATSGCPTVAEFKAIVAGRLGYDPFVEGMPDHVLVWIAPRGGAIDGRLEWRDATGGTVGEQTFPSVTTDCVRFVRVVGFALAVQIQLLANVRATSGTTAQPPEDAAPVSEPAPQPTVTPPVSPPRTVAEPPPVAVVATVPAGSPPSPGASWAVGVGSSLGFGMSSSPVLLGRILGALAWSRASLELGAEAGLTSITRRADGAGFSQQHLLVSMAGCALRGPWHACAVAKGGEVRMFGRDIDRPTSAAVPLLQAGLRVGAVQPLGQRVFVNARVEGLAAVTRWTATLDKTPVWTAPRLAATIGVDAVVRFP